MILKILNVRDLDKFKKMNINDVFKFGLDEQKIINMSGLITIGDILDNNYEEFYKILKRADITRLNNVSGMVFIKIVDYLHQLGFEFKGEKELYDTYKQSLSDGNLNLNKILRFRGKEEKEIFSNQNITSIEDLFNIIINLDASKYYYLKRFFERNAYVLDKIFNVGTSEFLLSLLTMDDINLAISELYNRGYIVENGKVIEANKHIRK